MADQGGNGMNRPTTRSDASRSGRTAADDAYLRSVVQGFRDANPEYTDMRVLDYFASLPGIGRPLIATTESGSRETPAQRHDRERAWEVVESTVARGGEPRVLVAVVGGGIAGLHCAYKLAQERGFEVTVYEASSRFGGRIETETLGDYQAEFGPMRFELQIQPLVDELAAELGVKFKKFPPPSNDEASARTGSSRYAIRHDELRHTRDCVGSSEPDPLPLATTPLDLLRLGVVRMFRQDLWDFLPKGKLECTDIGDLDLCVDTTLRPPPGAKETSPGTFHADGEPGQAEREPWTLEKLPDNGTLSSDPALQQRIRLYVRDWIDSLDDCAYDALRRNSRHRTGRSARIATSAETSAAGLNGAKGHFLRDEGFWNALGEELSPPALSFIRNEGTFYHLIPDNPNAVEWGVFWLRLLRSDAEELSGIPEGVGCLVEGLTKRLDDHAHVTLRAAQEVVEVAPGSGPHPVVLTIQDRRDNHPYTVEADHCILALPLAPIRRLSSHFPDQIKEDLTRTFGFDLLKCFLVVDNPWWRYDMPTQTGAGGVPTRELHFKRRVPKWLEDGEEESLAEKSGDSGMVMVYTDNPAYGFWRSFVESPIHNQAEIKKSLDLKRALVSHLMINARREAHRDLATLLLDEVAQRANELEEWNALKDAAQRFLRDVRRWVGDEPFEPSGPTESFERPERGESSQPLLKSWYERVVSEPPPVLTVENFERILDVLRHPGDFEPLFQECNAVREEVNTHLSSLPSARPDGLEINFAAIAVSVVFPQEMQSTPVVGGSEQPLDDQIEDALGHVVTWGIRDWSRLPVEGGCHAWSIGARSWEVMGRLEAFTLVGRRPDHPVRTVHVCGEAVSDYTGFIEGALRSARRAVNAILEA